MIDSTRAGLADIAGLAVFSSLKKTPLLRAFAALLEASETESAGTAKRSGCWAAFTGAFIRYADASFYSALASLTLKDDNPFTRAAEAGRLDAMSPVLRAAARADLGRLGRIAAFDIFALGLYTAAFLRDAGLEDAARNIEAEARAFADTVGNTSAELQKIFPADGWENALPGFGLYLRGRGAGKLGTYHSFFWAGTGTLRPVRNPDPVRFSDLSGYEDQRAIVIDNTLRFLEGKPANNILLYGDRGTGKSAAVKALCNEYADRGLRLLELRKQDLFQLTRILDTLSSRALFFILFIDDLSFENIDDSFTRLKALLEGGAGTKPANVLIYATSNRRHLVRERFADRPGPAETADGEVRAFDTMQEQFSLADRFGLTVVYAAPNQEEYLSIAEFLGRKRGLLPAGEAAGAEEAEALKQFRENALRWERWFNGRSPRTAVQYVDWAAGGAGFPWE